MLNLIKYKVSQSTKWDDTKLILLLYGRRLGANTNMLADYFCVSRQAICGILDRSNINNLIRIERGRRQININFTYLKSKLDNIAWQKTDVKFWQKVFDVEIHDYNNIKNSYLEKKQIESLIKKYAPWYPSSLRAAYLEKAKNAEITTVHNTQQYYSKESLLHLINSHKMNNQELLNILSHENILMMLYKYNIWRLKHGKSPIALSQIQKPFI